MPTERPKGCFGFKQPVQNPNIAPACIAEELGRGLLCPNCSPEVKEAVRLYRETNPRPSYWFILETYDEDARPPISKLDLEEWGGIAVPTYDPSAINPAHESSLAPEYPQEASITLSYGDIAAAALAAGRPTHFPPSLSSITVAQRLGKLYSNEMNFESPQDYLDYKDPFGGKAAAEKSE